MSDTTTTPTGDNNPQRGLWLACDADGSLHLFDGLPPTFDGGRSIGAETVADYLTEMNIADISGPIPAPGTAVRVKVVVETELPRLTDMFGRVAHSRGESVAIIREGRDE